MTKLKMNKEKAGSKRWEGKVEQQKRWDEKRRDVKRGKEDEGTEEGTRNKGHGRER